MDADSGGPLRRRQVQGMRKGTDRILSWRPYSGQSPMLVIIPSWAEEDRVRHHLEGDPNVQFDTEVHVLPIVSEASASATT